MTACGGTCNARWRQAQDAYTQALAEYDPLDPAQSRPDPPSSEPVHGEPVWCPRCAAKIRQCLTELDDLAALLAAVADGHRSGPDGQRVSGTQAHMSPSVAGDDVDELADVLSGWEQSYRDLRGWPSPPRRGFLASQVTTCIAWLTAHLDGLLTTDLAPDFGEEVMQWHRELAGKTRAGARRLRKPMRCPSCRLLMLTWMEGEEYVRCSNPECNRMLRLSEYEAEVDLMAGTTRETAA